MKQVKSEKEIEWQTKHWTIVSGSLPLTLVLIKYSFIEASITGIPLIDIDNMFLFVLCNNFNDALTYLFPSALYLVNLVFHTSVGWKRPKSCHVFLNGPISQF